MNEKFQLRNMLRNRSFAVNDAWEYLMTVSIKNTTVRLLGTVHLGYQNYYGGGGS